MIAHSQNIVNTFAQALEVEEVGLHEAARGLAGLVIVNEGQILLWGAAVAMWALPRLVHKECGRVQRGQDSVWRVVDGFVGDAIGLSEPDQNIRKNQSLALDAVSNA